MNTASTIHIGMIAYVLGFSVVAFVGALYCGFGSNAQRKLGARTVLVSPLWPLVLLVAIPIALRKLWRLAAPRANQ